MEKVIDLKDLLKHEIMDLYSAEEQIIEALPMMIEKAGNDKLKAALQDHLNVTQNQKSRLDEIKQLLSEDENSGEDEDSGEEKTSGEDEASDNSEASGKGNSSENKEEKKPGFFSRLFGGEEKCKGMEGLIAEGKKMMSADMSPEAADAAIIGSAQKIEHYEISGYGTARAFARELKLNEVANKLEQTLNEEYAADDLLTQLAVGKINVEAEHAEVSGGSNGTQDSRARSNGQRAAVKNNKSQNRSNAKSNGKAPAKKAATKPGPSRPSSKPSGAKSAKSPLKRRASNSPAKKVATKSKGANSSRPAANSKGAKAATKSKGKVNSRVAPGKSKAPARQKPALKKSAARPAKKTSNKSSSKSRSSRGR